MGSAAAGTHEWPGATALAALLQGAWLAVASAGDCRAVRFSKSSASAQAPYRPMDFATRFD